MRLAAANSAVQQAAISQLVQPLELTNGPNGVNSTQPTSSCISGRDVIGKMLAALKSKGAFITHSTSPHPISFQLTSFHLN